MRAPNSTPEKRPAGTPKVKLVGVAKRYGDVVAAEDVDLEVHEGEFVTLLGPSGSGKTTVLSLVAGLIAPTRGEIWLDGKNATHLPPHLRGLGMVFQNYALFPHMTVFDNIAFPLRMRRVPDDEIEKRVRTALEQVRLPEIAGRGMRQLSGGQQQRVALARALVYNPSVLLMDEPLGALDKKLRDHMKLELKQIQNRLGITVLYVTHDQEEALTMSDRIVVMHLGRIRQVGSPEDLYERPVSEFVADFVGESNLLRGRVEEVSGAHCRVALERGVSILVPNAKGTAPGARVTVMIRPERLRPLNDGQVTDNAFEAVVEEVLYLGEVIKYWVRLPGGQSLEAKHPAGEQAPRPRPGETVRIGWSARDSVTLVPDADTEAGVWDTTT